MDKMTESSIKERVLGAIQQEQVRVKPRWHFLLREWVVWFVAGVSLVVGSIATALTLYIADASFFVERHIIASPERNVFDMLPYVWIVLLLLGLFYSVHAFRGTRKGYHFQTGWIVGIAIGVSIGAGFTMHASGFGESVDRYLLAEVPIYQPLSGFRATHWMNKDVGIVAGFVEEVDQDVFVVRALDGARVEVRTTASTTYPHFFLLEEGVPVRIFGTSTSKETETLEAIDVRPFEGRGGNMRGRGDGGQEGPRMLRIGERQGVGSMR